MAETAGRKNGLAYIFTYLLTWLSGLIVYFTLGQNDKAIKFHAVQAFLLGVIMFIIGFLPLAGWIAIFLLWLYGLYIGWQGSQGKDIEIPIIGPYARSLSK